MRRPRSPLMLSLSLPSLLRLMPSDGFLLRQSPPKLRPLPRREELSVIVKGTQLPFPAQEEALIIMIRGADGDMPETSE